MSVLARHPLLDVAPGVYLVGEQQTSDAITRIADVPGFAVFVIDGSRVHNKASFLAAAAAAMHFPDYFGYNWDALDECIRDLEWAPAAGYVLLYDHFDRLVRADAPSWEVALAVFRTAIDRWQAVGIPMYVLLRGDATYAPLLPVLRLPER